MNMNLPLGPVMTDVAGLELTADDMRRLAHPMVGGVILFGRNYQDPEQLKKLTASIHALRTPTLPICVDHEGGRVQRFREGFTTIPPMRELGKLWDRSRIEALAAARAIGVIIGQELASHGVDFSFAPVLDVDYGGSTVIGHRAFHSDPSAIASLARSLMLGLNEAGVTNVGKHFPGHGYVRADSHHEIPVDDREFAEIWDKDMLPFRALSDGTMGGVMPAHVTYPKFDSKPAGFSEKWLKDVLRGRLGFDGVIFSDDLSMEGASVAGGVVSRAQAALGAGCDVVLICNDHAKADELLAGLAAVNTPISPELARRLDTLRCKTRAQQCEDARAVLARAGLAAA
jgi:beta-N-acetylhexosaminidase